MKDALRFLIPAAMGLTLVAMTFAQEPGQRGGPGGRDRGDSQREPGGRGRGGPGGPGGSEGRHRPPPPPLMTALDTDGDGELSASEIAQAAQSLPKLDKNGDGRLDRDELRPARPEGEKPGGPGHGGQAR